MESECDLRGEGLTEVPGDENLYTFRVDSPPGTRLVPIDVEGVEEIKHLTMRIADMATVQAVGAAFLQLPDTGDDTLPEALWRAAVITYGRAFAHDKRKHGQLDLNILDDTQRRAHQYLVDLRNRFVAHSDIEYETVLVSALLRRRGERAELLDVATRHLIGADFDKQGMEVLVDLATVLRDSAQAQAKTLIAGIYEAVKMIDIAELDALPDQSFTMPTIDDLGNRRRSHS